MGLKFPTFSLNNEYGMMNPDLYCVEYILRQESLEKAIAEAELAVLNAQRDVSWADTSVKHELLDLIAKSLPEQDPSIRQALLRKHLNDFREASALQGLAKRQKTEFAASQILALYAGLKSDLFEADFGAFANTKDDKTLAEALGAAKKRLDNLKRRLEDHRKGIAKCFAKGLPEEWKGHRIVKTVDAECFKRDQKALADRIVRAFAADWRSRAPLFSSPITIHGVLIQSLDTERRERWQKAYDAMKLGELKKRPVYSPIIEPRVAAPTAVPKGEFFDTRKEAELA